MKKPLWAADPRQFGAKPIPCQPAEPVGLCIKHGLKRQANGEQRGGHHERFHKHFGGERHTPQRSAAARARSRDETNLDEPNRQTDSCTVESASREVRERRLGWLIEKGPIGDADAKACNQDRDEKPGPLDGVPYKDRANSARLLVIQAPVSGAVSMIMRIASGAV